MERVKDEGRIALFIDAENLAIAAQKAGLPFRLKYIVNRVREEGLIVFSRAYADWTSDIMRRCLWDFQQNVIELAQLSTDGRYKNTADMQLTVDALEMSLLSAAPDTVVLVAGDRDYVPLVQKLKRYGRWVIGIGVRGSVNSALEQVCNLYLYYDHLVPGAEGAAASAVMSDLTPAFELLLRAAMTLSRQGREVLGSNTRVMMQQLDPTFDLASYGMATFKDFVQAAERARYIRIFPRDGQDFLLEANRTPSSVEQDARWGGQRFSFETSEEALESYRQMLEQKRVPLLPWGQREQLVRHLWEVLVNEPRGMRIADMTNALIDYALEHQMLVPERALQKITLSLNIGLCFARNGVPVFEQDIFNTLLTPAVGVEEALDRMNLTYLQGILRDHPDTPLLEDAVAQLLFDEEAEAFHEHAEDLIERCKAAITARAQRSY